MSIGGLSSCSWRVIGRDAWGLWSAVSVCGHAVQLTELMSTTSAGDADKAAKASLFIRLVEVRVPL